MPHYDTPPTLAIFWAASVLLALAPGPGVLYLLGRTLAYGRAAGLASVLGIALGTLANALIACMGLGALLKTGSRAFGILKLAGAGYLLWLGLQALRKAAPAHTTAPHPEPERAHAFRDAILVALFNPKTALFFAAFLPQFIDAHERAPILRSLELALAFVAIAACTDTGYVLAASALRSRFETPAAGRWARRASGLVFLGLGTYLALSEARPAR
jgi:threonine/homoserine/homoserine lactone efflux protein